LPLGFLSISIVCAALMTYNQKEKNRKRREAYQRGKVSAALLTDEQREENRKAYKRKKCHAHNKENKPGLHMFELMVGLLVHAGVNYCFI